jgi:shikimate kinase
MNAIANPLDPHRPLPAKTLALVGMPGAGKSSIGRRLAARLGLSFTDSDAEVEAAAGMKVKEIFEKIGEEAFREGERRVIARLLERPPQVLATGGGAFMDEATRALIRDRAISIWLRADFDLLLDRTSRNRNRPLLNGEDAEDILRKLLNEREPVYAQADIAVASSKAAPDETAERVLQALCAFAASGNQTDSLPGKP